jgi:hypothetical protein
MSAHKHTPRYVEGSERCFTGSVAHEPYTHEEPAAHGNITVDEECVSCGALRKVNVNQLFVECSPWGPSAAERARQEEAERRARAAAAQATQAHADLAAAQSAGLSVIRQDADQVLVSVGGEARWTNARDLVAAARQADNGDGLVPAYRHICRVLGLVD